MLICTFWVKQWDSLLATTVLMKNYFKYFIQLSKPLPLKDYPKIVEKLIKAGALMTAVDVDQDTPLHVAADAGEIHNQNRK